ncbi:Uncharacterized protein APZ42_029917 [Daphnia magna]|uniref:Reverse transcriptase domain-containing protein n=1 Tax=Daphnia magna TaxID=35525 RepID=A0A164P778_9CRUS|nr:Uncharacterized protein APZ42_029917 [Daphnia magna]
MIVSSYRWLLELNLNHTSTTYFTLSSQRTKNSDIMATVSLLQSKQTKNTFLVCILQLKTMPSSAHKEFFWDTGGLPIFCGGYCTSAVTKVIGITLCNTLPIELELNANPNPLLTEGDAAVIYADCLQTDLLKQEKLELSFQAEDLVLVYKPFRKVGKSEKLLHRWLGPIKVLRHTTPVNYEVISATSRGKYEIIQVARMNSFHGATLECQSPQASVSGNTETPRLNHNLSLKRKKQCLKETTRYLMSVEMTCSPPPLLRNRSLEMQHEGLCGTEDLQLDGTLNVSDDILTWGRDEDEHERRLHSVLSRLNKLNLTSNRQDKFKFVGFIFSRNGIEVDPEKIKAVTSLNKPESCEAVRNFLGMANFVRRFVSKFADITAPLRKLRKTQHTSGQLTVKSQ